MGHLIRISAPNLPELRLRLRGDGPWTVGARPDCSIPLRVLGVSRLHFELTRQEDGSLSFLDLGSTNGTFLNGERRESGQLLPGSAIQAGLGLLILEDTVTDNLPFSPALYGVSFSSFMAIKPHADAPGRKQAAAPFGVAEMASLLERFIQASPKGEQWAVLSETYSESLGCLASQCFWIQGDEVLLRASTGEFPEDRVPPALAQACAMIPHLASFEKHDEGKAPVNLLSLPIHLGDARAVFLGLLPPGEDPIIHKQEALMALPVVFRLVLQWAEELRESSRTVESLRQKVTLLRNQRELGTGSREPILGASPAFLSVLDVADRAAPSDATVLITGESGTGKELVARRIHRLSRRSEGPFLPLNCPAIPESLFESELFGAEKGAFTGAARNRKGLVHSASGGTLFLDEVGDLPLLLQSKLLRFVEDRRVVPLGGGRASVADVRIIAASNRNLRQLVLEGKFREDLFYRLNTIALHIPPLRERGGDVDLLVDAFLEYANREFGKSLRDFDPDARIELQRYPWPGNVRELLATVKRLVFEAEGRTIGSEEVRRRLHIPDEDPGPTGKKRRIDPL